MNSSYFKLPQSVSYYHMKNYYNSNFWKELFQRSLCIALVLILLKNEKLNKNVFTVIYAKLHIHLSCTYEKWLKNYVLINKIYIFFNVKNLTHYFIPKGLKLSSVTFLN